MDARLALGLCLLVTLAGCGTEFGAQSPTVETTGERSPVTESPVGSTSTETSGDDPTPATATAVQSVDEPFAGDEERVRTSFVADGERSPTFRLAVADNDSERRRGLMDRESLAERSGMVFVFDDAAPRTFWMKNTSVPLDIVFLDANLTVINVEHATPQPNATDANLKRYRSDAPAQYVVELPRGTANETVVGPGATMAVHRNRTTATAG